MPAPPDPKRPLLIGGVVLMAVGAGLEVGSRYQPPGGLLDTVSPWVVLAGSILTVFYFVVRRAASAPQPDRRESVVFDDSTQMDDPTRGDRR